MEYKSNQVAENALQVLIDGRRQQMDAWSKAGQINVDFLERINQVALDGAQKLVARQSTALRSTFDEFDSLMRAFGQIGNGTLGSEVQKRCMTTSVQRALEHVQVAMDCAQEMNQATFEIMKERLETFLPATKDAEDREAPAQKSGGSRHS